VPLCALVLKPLVASHVAVEVDHALMVFAPSFAIQIVFPPSTASLNGSFIPPPVNVLVTVVEPEEISSSVAVPVFVVSQMLLLPSLASE
jgi:hypothetical protein